jgi:hypothetical protein
MTQSHRAEGLRFSGNFATLNLPALSPGLSGTQATSRWTARSPSSPSRVPMYHSWAARDSFLDCAAAARRNTPR